MSREAGLFQALTATDRLSDLLPVLHHHAVSAVDGRSSIVFQYSRSGDLLHATSAFGLDHLPHEGWPGRMLPEGLFRNGTPVCVDDIAHAVPGAPEFLGSMAAILVPLTQAQESIGVLVIGCDTIPSAQQLSDAAAVGHAFVMALERARAAADDDLQHQLRDLLQAFARDVSNTTMAAGLEALCHGANRLFGADRTSVWLHDRRARAVVLSASSDVVYLAEARRIPTSDPLAPAVLGLRRERAEIASTGTADGGLMAMVTIPLKGKRRALGTLVMEDVRIEPGAQMELVERAEEMGRQMSSAIENVLLLDAMLRSRRELENTFNSLADLVAVSDEEGRLVYMNLAFLERIGRPRQELIDRPLAQVVGAATNAFIARVTGSDQSGSDPREYRAAQTPIIQSSEVDDEALGGTFHLTLTPLVGEAREPMGVVLVARDITAQSRLEAERTELRNRLVQSEKLAALGQFVAGIAHELNNPLQGVLGHLELLRATGAFPKGLRRDMQRIYREADRAAKIVRNLLVFAGSRRLVRRRTSINATLSRVLALRAPAFRAAGIEVVRHHEEGLPRVKADPLLIQQAILNIVLNAEQAIGAGGGRIESRTSVRDENGTRRVVVEIRDTGPGIPAASMSRLFEPFFTTKEVGKGTGLGLAITYGIIQEHGGRIIASNHPEGGAVFTVHLPVESE
ncbi:MAG: PAS domain S-box protein [Acidobacteria bacterium]|nr:MAG: PAS domain S-box protein [Acidobacteriota bacterium]